MEGLLEESVQRRRPLRRPGGESHDLYSQLDACYDRSSFWDGDDDRDWVGSRRKGTDRDREAEGYRFGELQTLTSSSHFSLRRKEGRKTHSIFFIFPGTC